jgi:hypothetical protein
VRPVEGVDEGVDPCRVTSPVCRAFHSAPYVPHCPAQQWLSKDACVSSQ